MYHAWDQDGEGTYLHVEGKSVSRFDLKTGCIGRYLVPPPRGFGPDGPRGARVCKRRAPDFSTFETRFHLFRLWRNETGVGRWGKEYEVVFT